MKFCIDAGHGGLEDPGATFQGAIEADIVLLTAICLKEYLREMGHQVVLTRGIDEYIDLASRVSIANTEEIEAYISLHVNADPDEDLEYMPQARGEEIWIYRGSIRGRKLAEAISMAVDRIFPSSRFRGIKETRSLYVLRKTKMPAVLIELGFIDSLSEFGGESLPPRAYIRMARLLGDALNDYALGYY